MNGLEQVLSARFGENRVKQLVEINEAEFPMLVLTLDLRSEITVLMTNGLRHYDMPVPEKYKDKNRTELYFCLPSYWDKDNLQQQWVFEWIQKMAKHVVDKQTWFGAGHTIPNGNPAEALSSTMKQKYLLLNDPMFLKEQLKPAVIDGVEVNFLGIIPIFEDEMDYKMGKGTYKLLQKMEAKGVSELLDDFRLSALKSKWRIFKK